MQLDAESTERGIGWLKRNGAKRLGLDQAVLDRVVSFRFSGESLCYSNSTAVPVWTAVLDDGRRFDYYAVSWQAQAWPDGGPFADPAWASPVRGAS